MIFFSINTSINIEFNWKYNVQIKYENLYTVYFVIGIKLSLNFAFLSNRANVK